jgi:hypothetical protein
VARDRSTSKTTCLALIFTAAIMIATIVQAGVAWLNYQTAKSAKPVVSVETRN